MMRPSHSCQDMELKSLKKKYKDKKFAAGCSRDVIAQGAERLGWELDMLLSGRWRPCAPVRSRWPMRWRSCEKMCGAKAPHIFR